MNDDEYQALQTLLKILAGLGQGVEVSNYDMIIGTINLQKFHASLPWKFDNNLELTRNDLEIPRAIVKYAIAAFGWRGLNVWGKGRGIVADSFRSNPDLRAILYYLGLDEADIPIYQLEGNILYRPNFFVAIDRKLSAVILSIRGTMSLQDIVTDLSCECVPFDRLKTFQKDEKKMEEDGNGNGNGGEELCHSGFLSAAHWFVNILGERLINLAVDNNLDNIYFTGHSLGGCIASMTLMVLVDRIKRRKAMEEEKGSSIPWQLLNREKRPIRIHGYAFGPAPSLSLNLAKEADEYLDSFVYGSDSVPRICYGSVLDFQAMLVYAAELGNTGHLFKIKLPTDLTSKLHECRNAIRRNLNYNEKLYIAGRVHHIINLAEPGGGQRTVIDTCDKERFDELILHNKMLTSHLPPKYEKGIERAYLDLSIDETIKKTASKDGP